MAEIVNLRLARKARARSEATARAAENRALHGRTKAERLMTASDAERSDKSHEAHRREPD